MYRAHEFTIGNRGDRNGKGMLRMKRDVLSVLTSSRRHGKDGLLWTVVCAFALMCLFIFVASRSLLGAKGFADNSWRELTAHEMRPDHVAAAIRHAASSEVDDAMASLHEDAPESLSAFKLGLIAAGVAPEVADSEAAQMLRIPSSARSQLFDTLKSINGNLDVEDTVAKLKRHIKEHAGDYMTRQAIGKWFAQEIFQAPVQDPDIADEILDLMIESFDEQARRTA